MRVPVGLAQGSFRLHVAASGHRSLVRDQRGLTLVDGRSGALERAPGVVAFDYGQVVARIQRAVQLRRKREAGRRASAEER